MIWTPLDSWIVLAAALSAASCALLGSLLLVRRMSMMGDAISHAVLPGLAMAFLITGSRDSLPMLAGAVAAGLLTAVLSQTLHRWAGVDEGAAMGVVFTTLFAAGLVMVVRAADKVDLDPGCVLYGALEMTPLDTVAVGSWQLPRAVVWGGCVGLANLILVGLLFKELRLAAFDPELAAAQGYRPALLHYLLMIMVAVTAVACFETVGSILVIAMLVVPAAAARLCVDRMGSMMVVAVLLAMASAAVGHLAAITVPTWFGYSDTNTAGTMAVVAGLFFTLAWLLSPRQGLISRAWHRRRLALAMAADDVLGSLYRNEEFHGRSSGLSGKALETYMPPGVRRRQDACRWLAGQGWITGAEHHWSLSEAGRAVAADIIRSHRLWEQYLFERAAVRADHVHATAEALEHVTSPTIRQELAREVHDGRRDPHGHPIPESAESRDR